MTRKKTKIDDNKITLLIDGDIICYQIACNQEQEVPFGDDGDGPIVLLAEPKDCYDEFNRYINFIKEKLLATSVVICFSDKQNFRKTVYSGYKANRKDQRKPLGLSKFKEEVARQHCTIVKPGLEADDVLGIIATLDSKQFMGKRVIVSIDKDLEQIPGYIFNPNKDEKIRKVTEEDAQLRFWTQVLTGDATDGYPGCPGMGPVGAEKIIGTTSEEGMWEAIVQAYEKKGLDEEFALQMARCAKLLDSTLWDFKKQEVILWNPPKKN